MAGTIQVKHEGHVVRVTLAHSGKLNAMSRAMWRLLKTTFASLQSNASVRCVVMVGADGHFCAGGDIAEYPGFRYDAALLEHFHEHEVWGALQAMLDCDVPIVAQIQGNCMGAGIEIASCCDLRLAGASARFGAPIARLGFPMAPREAALVAQYVGATTARAMLLAAQVFDAPHMLAANFLTQLVPDEGLEAQTSQLAQRIAALAPQAARLNKQTFRALNRSPGAMEYAQAATDLIAKEAAESTAQTYGANAYAYAYANSPEHREGITAFLQKRQPEF
jgi:enoyl-CoA hydratase/carnithine racemase